MKNIPLLLGTIIGTLLLVFGIAYFFSKTAPTSIDANVDQAVLLEGSRHSTGPEDAPVVVVEFSDLQCPACAATQPLVKQLLEEYPDDVRLVYRHFPLDDLHPYARLAATASEVAAEYDQFWAYHDTLFATQQEWSLAPSKSDVEAKLVSYATELGIDETEFTAKIADTVYSDFVQLDAKVGIQIGIQATPTFFVNGQQTAAPQLREAVASVLAK